MKTPSFDPKSRSQTEAKSSHGQTQHLRSDHEPFFHAHIAYIPDSKSNHEHNINIDLTQAEQHNPYEAYNKPTSHPQPFPWATLRPPTLFNPQLRHQTISSIHQLQRWTSTPHSNVSWLLNLTLPLNHEWTVFLSCGLALEQLWRKEQSQNVYRNLCADVDCFLVQCEGYEVEFWKRYEPWVGNMLGRLVRCREGLEVSGEILRGEGWGEGE